MRKGLEARPCEVAYTSWHPAIFVGPTRGWPTRRVYRELEGRGPTPENSQYIYNVVLINAQQYVVGIAAQLVSWHVIAWCKDQHDARLARICIERSCHDHRLSCEIRLIDRD